MNRTAVIERIFPSERVDCPLCGSKDFEPVYDQASHLKFFGRGMVLDTELHIAMCGRCGLLRQNPRLSKADIQRFYQETAHYEVGTPAEVRPGRIAVARVQIEYACHGDFSVLPDMCVAEIGCSGGHLLEMLKPTGANLVGVELSATDCEHARRRGIVTFCGAWEEIDFPFPPDLIFACHVLEHTPTPDIFLDKIANSLTPRGRVYIEVEDLLQPRIQLASVFFIEHMFYFTPRTLTHLLWRCGLQPLHLDQCSDNPPDSGMDYPVIRCVAIPQQPGVSPPELESDAPYMREVLRRYFGLLEASRSNWLGKLQARLDRWRSQGIPYAIFGTGGHTQQLFVLLPNLLHDPYLKVFLDNNENLDGTQFAGVPVCHPRKAKEFGLRAVLISSREFEDEIYRQILPLQDEGIEIGRIYGGQG